MLSAKRSQIENDEIRSEDPWCEYIMHITEK